MILGIIALLFGSIQGSRHEKEGIQLTVTISDIKTSEDFSDVVNELYTHTYYADYTYNGKEYTHVEVSKTRTSSWLPTKKVGDTIDIVLDPDDPEKMSSDGGILSVIGCITIIVCIVLITKKRKSEKYLHKQPQTDKM